MASPSIIFYSWQSDLPNATNRRMIQEALERAARAIRQDNLITVEPVIDRDTAGVPGSPDISTTILAKIDACDIFVADVSIINATTTDRPTPNPNVLIELGYALKRLGWERIILVCNTAYGDSEKLPFDLRQKRFTPYTASEDQPKADARRNLEKTLEDALRTVYEKAPPITQTPMPVEPLPTERDFRWYIAQQKNSQSLLLEDHPHGSLEAFSVLALPRTKFQLQDLHQAARQAQDIRSDWPIGVILDSKNPSPRNDGITYDLRHDFGGSNRSRDYWYIRNDGALYLLTTLTEDRSTPSPGQELWYDLRIKRTAELLLYLFHLYQNLSVSLSTRIHVSLRLQGLQGRRLTATPSQVYMSRIHRIADEDTYTNTLDTTVDELDSKLVEHVIHLSAPVLSLFDFFQASHDDYERFVQEVRNGRW